MSGIYWGSSQSILPGPLSSPSWQGLLLRKTVHLVEYAVLATLLWRALLNTRPAQTKVEHGQSNDTSPRVAALSSRRWTFPLAFVIPLFYAIFDEWHQSFVPNREARLLDVGVDMVGMVMSLGLIRWRSGSK